MRVILIALVVLLAFIGGIFPQGCAPIIGIMPGMLEGERVTFTYNYMPLSIVKVERTGKLSVTLPDGEHFKGEYIQQSVSGSPGSLYYSLSKGLEALLLGDKGNSMECRFVLTDKVGGIDWGGIGICRVSDGRNINVKWEMSGAAKKSVKERDGKSLP